MFKEYSKDIKRTWSTINELLNVKKASHTVPDVFIVDGKVYSGAEEISEGFNEFFSSVGTNLADNNPHCGEGF